MRNLAQVCGAVSKAEEEELCLKQLELVSSKLSQPGVTVGTMSDCMVCKKMKWLIFEIQNSQVRIIHIAHLGYDTTSAHIHCVKLAGAGTILQRKMG